MSVSRVFETKAARKEYTCEKCHEPIPKGSPYLYFFTGFRSAHKRTRHTTCRPRTSELETSKKSTIYAAIEEAEDSLDALGEFTEVDDVESIIEGVYDAFREVIDEYREAGMSWGDGSGMSKSDEIADDLEQGMASVENWQSTSSDFDEADVSPCDLHTDDSFADSTDDGGDGEDGLPPMADAERIRAECTDCRDLRLTALQEWQDTVLTEARDALSDASV
jgi:hypothetical protein